jgi:hypothetical protein
MIKFLLPLQNLSGKFLNFLSELKGMKRNSASQPLIFFEIGREKGLRENKEKDRQRETIINTYI